MTLILHYAPVACSLVPYVALTEANAPFEVLVVDFMKGKHLTPEFLRLNPKHKVPVLVVDGEALTENVAILQWIAHRYPAAHLLPAEGPEQFKSVAFLAWCASGIHPHLTPNVLPQRYCDLPGSAESVRRCAHKMLGQAFEIAESQLGDRSWFFSAFSAADIYFFWCFRRAKMFNLEATGLPHCRAHFDRMMDRASVRQLVAFEAKTLQEIRS